MNVFTRFEDDRSRARRLLTSVDRLKPVYPGVESYRSSLQDDQRRLAALEPILRRWAVQGLEGGTPTEASTVLTELSAIETDLDTADAGIHPPM